MNNLRDLYIKHIDKKVKLRVVFDYFDYKGIKRGVLILLRNDNFMYNFFVDLLEKRGKVYDFLVLDDHMRPYGVISGFSDVDFINTKKFVYVTLGFRNFLSVKLKSSKNIDLYAKESRIFKEDKMKIKFVHNYCDDYVASVFNCERLRSLGKMFP